MLCVDASCLQTAEHCEQIDACFGLVWLIRNGLSNLLKYSWIKWMVIYGIALISVLNCIYLLKTLSSCQFGYSYFVTIMA